MPDADREPSLIRSVARRARPRRSSTGSGAGPRRPFRFGLTAYATSSGSNWRDQCRRAEDLGFDTLVVPDHLGDQLSPVPALTAAAMVTTTLRVGVLVAANDFRHPVVHAKELATLDVLSGGRVEWGMGAGWLAAEYRTAGIPFGPAAARVDRLEEAVEVMKGLFGDGPVAHEGTHYTLREMDGQPKPLQRPHPPLLIGGAGERMLRFAAREADVIGLMPSPTGARVDGGPRSDDAGFAVDRQVGWLKEAAGRRFEDLELNMVAFPAIITDSPAEPAAQWSAHLQLDPAEVIASPHVWIGSVDEICDALMERRERWGVSYWVVGPMMDVDAVSAVVARLAGA